jgi:hypothetical protein
MQNLKHVGQVRSSGRRCLVAYRTLPGDAYHCLIIPTESLPDSYHDALIKLVESNAAQNSFEFWEILQRSTFPDGSTMLVSLHSKGFLAKVATDDIEMIPDSHNSIRLSELNSIIAQQRGVSVQDLAVLPEEQKGKVTEVASVSEVPTPVSIPVEEPLTDEMLAAKLRQDALRLGEEVKALLAQAEMLSPSIQPTDTEVATTLTDDVVTDVKRPARKSKASS